MRFGLVHPSGTERNTYRKCRLNMHPEPPRWSTTDRTSSASHAYRQNILPRIKRPPKTSSSMTASNERGQVRSPKCGTRQETRRCFAFSGLLTLFAPSPATLVRAGHFSTMLNLNNLRTLLSQVLLPPALRSAILFTPEGQLVSYASDATTAKDEIRVIVGLSSEIWRETRDLGVGMVDSEVSPFFMPSTKV